VRRIPRLKPWAIIGRPYGTLTMSRLTLAIAELWSASGGSSIASEESKAVCAALPTAVQDTRRGSEADLEVGDTAGLETCATKNGAC
jgi:hypothetical protein